MNHNTQKNFQLFIQQHLTTNKLFCILSGIFRMVALYGAFDTGSCPKYYINLHTDGMHTCAHIHSALAL